MAAVLADKIVEERYKRAATHAGTELSTQGTWTCDCSACSWCRAASTAVLTVGRCQWCDVPLQGRKGKKFCCENHRIRAFQLRQRKKPKTHLYPLFEPTIAGRVRKK